MKHEFPDLIKGSEYEISYNPTVMPRVRFVMEGIQIDPNDGRLRFRPNSPDLSRFELISKLASAICGRLPHTPTRAVGHNFVYEADADEHLIVTDFVAQQKQDEFYERLQLGATARTQIRHSFSASDHQVNMIYNARQDGENVVFNFHYPATNSARVTAAIEAYCENFRTAERLNRQLFAKIKT